MPLDSVFRLHARNRPDKAAIRDGERCIDFRTLDRLIDGTAHSFLARGIVRGQLVGVGLEDRPGHLIALLALARLGAVILPMDCRWHMAEKHGMAEQFGAAHVLLEASDRALGRSGWHGLAEADFVPSDEPYLDPEIADDAPLLLSLSSGTTGRPKGPRATHRQFENRFMAYWINLGMNAQDVFVANTPLYFGGGRGFTLATLFAGGTVSLLSARAGPDELAAHLRSVGGTVLFMVPTQLRRALEAGLPQPAFPTLRVLISSGSALHPEERKAIVRQLTPNLFEFYGSTEGGAVSILTPADGALRSDSVGRPAFRVEVEIVHPETHERLPPGEVGRLRYRSPASAREYYRADGSEAFRDGWFYPGDLARLDADGFLVLAGRMKDMIIRGGVNIYPGDVEAVLAELPGVRDVSVAGAPSRQMGEEVAAFLATDGSVTEESVRAICRERLAPYKVPSIVRFVSEIPRNHGGKVVKADLVASLSAEAN